ncbi:LppA family lipoprotein [Mycobacterium hubeiense]|uniref:LppA family lipoprotein n=1 Tax=Mycobacterium hubeiense TaxID=1867256 RepID=UPI00115B0E67|nr:LppA family lipoprotein [Mycobacterium sp. QGD 101]
MSEQSESQRPSRWRIVGWTVGVIAVVAAVAAIVFFVWLSNALSPKQEPPMNPDQVAALENDLRAKGSAEEALARYESVLEQTANGITDLVPGLTWRWNREVNHVSCAGPLMETRGVQVLTRHIVFDGPIPDDVWPQALQLVRDSAAKLGAFEVHYYVDEPGRHDVAVFANDGPEVRFGTWKAASLSARSDCYLKQEDL